jgi:hypothetical protein
VATLWQLLNTVLAGAHQPYSSWDDCVVTTNAEAWGDKIEPLRASLDSLPTKETWAFALACAERLVNAGSADRQRELSEILSEGWAVFESGRGDCSSLRTAMISRADIDDDPVAAVYYALELVDGQAQRAWSVANRAIDAAFELISYPHGVGQFHSLSEDVQRESVQRELTWQRESLDRLTVHGATPATVQSLRSTR